MSSSEENIIISSPLNNDKTVPLLNKDCKVESSLIRKESLRFALNDDPAFCKLGCSKIFGYIWTIIVSATPISITLAIENGETLVNLYWVGTLNDEKMLGGVGLGNMWTNTLGIVAILAFNTAL